MARLALAALLLVAGPALAQEPAAADDDLRALFVSALGDASVTVVTTRSWYRGEWVPWLREATAVRSDGKMLEQVNQYHHASDSTWQDRTRLLNTYDAAGNLTMETSLARPHASTPGPVSLVNFQRRAFEYTATGAATLSLHQYWNASGLGTAAQGEPEWVNKYRERTTYFPDDTPMTISKDEWDESEYEWTPLYTQTNNSNGDPAMIQKEDWHDGMQVNGQRTTYTYDAMQQKTIQTHETWKGTAWVKFSQQTWTTH